MRGKPIFSYFAGRCDWGSCCQGIPEAATASTLLLEFAYDPWIRSSAFVVTNATHQFHEPYLQYNTGFNEVAERERDSTQRTKPPSSGIRCLL